MKKQFFSLLILIVSYSFIAKTNGELTDKQAIIHTILVNWKKEDKQKIDELSEKYSADGENLILHNDEKEYGINELLGSFRTNAELDISEITGKNERFRFDVQKIDLKKYVSENY